LRRRVAYLTGRSYRGRPLAPGAVPALEETSRALILAAGEEREIGFDTVYWDDAALPSCGYDAAIIRTCWDYHERSEQFLATLEAHENAGLAVFNPPSVVRWNVRKTYLKDLGVFAIPTVWVERAQAHVVAQAFDTLDAAEIVLKPQVGAGSIGTVRLKRNAWSEVDLIGGPRGAAMIQPFLRAIETEGERSLFWFGGVFSHAIRKVPKSGDWRANLPGQTAFTAEAPPAAALQVAERARALAPADLLYVRIDLVLGDDGQWRVIEVEAIEPYLFLDLAPEGARAFVDAIARVLG
jgi:glutathione synthase/RimK-type ligase-like ATP-grasp enzyme